MSTLKNAYLSSNSYNLWMQLNIAMKFAGYVAWILLCKICKFGEKFYYNSRDIDFFLGDYFLEHPVHDDLRPISLLPTLVFEWIVGKQLLVFLEPNFDAS